MLSSAQACEDRGGGAAACTPARGWQPSRWCAACTWPIAAPIVSKVVVVADSVRSCRSNTAIRKNTAITCTTQVFQALAVAAGLDIVGDWVPSVGLRASFGYGARMSACPTVRTECTRSETTSNLPPGKVDVGAPTPGMDSGVARDFYDKWGDSYEQSVNEWGYNICQQKSPQHSPSMFRTTLVAASWMRAAATASLGSRTIN